MFYLIVILLSMLLIVWGNLLVPSAVLPTLVLSTVAGTAAVIVWDGIQALLIRRLLPSAWFAPDKRLFAVSKSEHVFYRRLRINSWKHLVPELGGFTNFHKNEFAAPNDPAYLGRFLLESNYGVVIHLANALLGPMILLLPLCSQMSVGLPIALVNFILSILPLAVLRFNTASLRSIYLHKTKAAIK